MWHASELDNHHATHEFVFPVSFWSLPRLLEVFWFLNQLELDLYEVLFFTWFADQRCQSTCPTDPAVRWARSSISGIASTEKSWLSYCLLTTLFDTWSCNSPCRDSELVVLIVNFCVLMLLDNLCDPQSKFTLALSKFLVKNFVIIRKLIRFLCDCSVVAVAYY